MVIDPNKTYNPPPKPSPPQPKPPPKGPPPSPAEIMAIIRGGLPVAGPPPAAGPPPSGSSSSGPSGVPSSTTGGGGGGSGSGKGGKGGSGKGGRGKQGRRGGRSQYARPPQTGQRGAQTTTTQVVDGSPTALQNVATTDLAQWIAEGMGGGDQGPAPQTRSILDYVNDLINALITPPPGTPMGIPGAVAQGYPNVLPGTQQPGTPPAQGYVQGPSQPAPSGVPLPIILKTTGAPPPPPVIPGLGPVQPGPLGAETDRLTNLAGAYGVAPGLTPYQTALNIPWTALGFDDHYQGAGWAQDFANNYGVWPWEGPGTEEENLGQNLGAYYSINDWDDFDIYGEYMGDWIDYYNPYPYPSYTPPVEEPGWFWGGGGGGWGNNSYQPYQNPWFYSDMQGGI